MYLLKKMYEVSQCEAHVRFTKISNTQTVHNEKVYQQKINLHKPLYTKNILVKMVINSNFEFCNNYWKFIDYINIESEK